MRGEGLEARGWRLEAWVRLVLGSTFVSSESAAREESPLRFSTSVVL